MDKAEHQSVTFKNCALKFLRPKSRPRINFLTEKSVSNEIVSVKYLGGGEEIKHRRGGEE